MTTHFDLLSAWRRRSLALDLARLANFQEIEGRVQHLFAAQQRTQPQGYAQITLDQIIETGRQLWIRLCSTLGGRLRTAAGADRPLDAELKSLRQDPEIHQYLLPLPSAALCTPRTPPEPPAGRLKHKRPNPGAPFESPAKRPDKGATHRPSPGLQLPPGCVAKTPEGKPLCFAFNRNACRYTGKGPRCARGFHLCYKAGCHAPKPFCECSHSATQ